MVRGIDSSHVQPPMTDRHRAVARLLAALGPMTHCALREKVRPGGNLSMPQFITLRALSDSPKTSSDLARTLGISRPTVTRLIDGMVRKGLVARQVDSADRRSSCIALTEAGHEVQRVARAQADDHLAALLSGLPDASLHRAELALTDIIALFERQGFRDVARSSNDAA
ncbi:MAG: MarR family transcriptional regulator [Chloroflexi bacterium]|nr:MarR family transcriptional regulator [Chloroflexota bacterium]